MVGGHCIGADPYNLAHDKFGELAIPSITNSCSAVYDVKGFLPEEVVDKKL